MDQSLNAPADNPQDAINDLNARKAAALDRVMGELTELGFDKNEPINGGDCVESIAQIYERLTKEFGAALSKDAEAMTFRVSLYCDNPDTRESRLVGEWTGLANSKHEARQRAHDELWDGRLYPAGASASYEVEELDHEDIDGSSDAAFPRMPGC